MNIAARFSRHVAVGLHMCRLLPGASRLYSSGGMLDLAGIFPPIPTPFNTDESIAWDKLDENITKWNSIPLSGYVVQGSNGEYQFMNAAERVDMVKRVKEISGPNRKVIAGSGCESTRDTIDMSRQMAAAGADAVMVVTPSYYRARMTSEAFVHHFTKVADDSPVPVILYSVPGNTVIDLAPDVVIKLAKHPNIIGLKDSGGDIQKIGNMVYKTAAMDFQILAGSAGFLYPGYLLGCVGCVPALANILGKDVCRLDQLAREGSSNQAKVLQQRMIAVNTAVTKTYGVAGMKQAMEWFGFYGGPTRSPLLPLTDEEKKKLKNIFTSAGFL